MRMKRCRYITSSSWVYLHIEKYNLKFKEHFSLSDVFVYIFHAYFSTSSSDVAPKKGSCNNSLSCTFPAPIQRHDDVRERAKSE